VRWSIGCSTRSKRGEADLVTDFAAAIPVEVIGNLLGVPPTSAGRCANGRSQSSAHWNRC
jgi:cytochrome P450